MALRLPTLGVFLALASVGWAASAPADHSTANLKVFDRVCALVRDHYYDATFHGVDWAAANTRFRPDAAAAPDDATLHRGINAMLHLLHDGHTELIPPHRASLVRKGTILDVGFGLRSIEQRWVVTQVFQGSPAERGGVQPGWILARLNGTPLDQPRPGFSPKSGEAVQFEFIDPHDKTVTLDLPFKTIRHQPRDFEMATDDIAHVVYLWFEQFEKAETRWLYDKISDAGAPPVSPAVVIDLRDNIGGDIIQVGDALGYFLPRPITFGRLVSRAKKNYDFKTFNLPRFLAPRYPGPIVVLVGPHTSSAAEIFATIMQQQHRALIVGQPTAGAVLGSGYFPLPNGALLQVSTADFILPDGTRLEGKGVQPDIVTPATTLAQLRAKEDPTIVAAMEALAQNKAPVPP